MIKSAAIVVTALGLIGWTWYASRQPPPAPAPAQPALTPEKMTAGAQTWTTKDKYDGTTRRIARRQALEALGQPWGSFCGREGHRNLISGLSYYFGQRSLQQDVYAKTWGSAGARHIAGAWSTADDNRIERLTLETMERGYLIATDLQPYARDMVAELARGAKVHGRPCSNEHSAAR